MPAAAASQEPPVPDPTVLTTAQLLRVANAERDYVDGVTAVLTQRINAIDKATVVFNEQLTRVPTETQREVGHLSGLMAEKFQSVKLQFEERDKRSERESRDNKTAVDAAFSAQKEASAKQDESNQKAIDKSEKATNDSIIKLAEVVAARTADLDGKIDDVKSRMSAIELNINGIVQSQLGARTNVTEHRQNQSAIYAAIGVVVTLVLAAMSVITFIIVNKSP